MPGSAEEEIRRRGGAVRYRAVTHHGKVIRIAIVRKAGPRGGHSLALYKFRKRLKKRAKKKGRKAA